jgi:hypothetical protein
MRNFKCLRTPQPSLSLRQPWSMKSFNDDEVGISLFSFHQSSLPCSTMTVSIAQENKVTAFCLGWSGDITRSAAKAILRTKCSSTVATGVVLLPELYIKQKCYGLGCLSCCSSAVHMVPCGDQDVLLACVERCFSIAYLDYRRGGFLQQQYHRIAEHTTLLAM